MIYWVDVFSSVAFSFGFSCGASLVSSLALGAFGASCVAGVAAAGVGLGSYLKVSTNCVWATSVRNFWISMDMPRFAIWMPSM